MSEWQEAEQRVQRAHELYEKGRWEEALTELRAAIAINPNNSAWYFNLGLTLDMMERFEEAVAAYDKALEIDPQDLEILNSAGADCIRLARYQQAIAHFESIEKLDPSFEAAYCPRILAYSELGDHQRAEEIFYLARQYKEKCPACFYNMGASLLARGQYDRALWCWQQVLDAEPDYPQIHARMADAHWAKGQLQEARRHLLEELRSDPGNVDTLLDLGELLMELGPPEAAAEKFRQVLDLEPEECTAHFHLGSLAQADGDYPLALERFRYVLRHDSQFVGAHVKMARIHWQLKNRTEALYHANCELAQSDYDEATLMDLGALFMDMQVYDGAETTFRRVLGMDGQHVDACHGLAVAMLFSGRVDEGIAQCRATLRLQPKYMLAMSNLALAYVERGDLARAGYWLGEALDIAPDDPQLRHLSKRLRVLSVWHFLRRLVTPALRWLGWGRR